MRTNKSILIVDSDPAARARLRPMLVAHGYAVAQAGSLAAALDALTELAWAFVIVGYQLSDGSGLEFVRIAQEQAPDVAVILMGDRRQATALAALRGGAADYLPAPVHEADLLAALTRATPARRSGLAARYGPTPPQADSAPTSPDVQPCGATIATLVHEISNPLTPIIGMAELLLEDLPPGHPGRDYATMIKAAAWRIRDVVRRLRTRPEGQSGDELIQT
jgi:ActR/RegA family two-component response regulator